MWYLTSNPSSTYSCKELAQTISSEHSCVTVLDGPSGCGKTFLLHMLQRNGGQIILSNYVVEKLIKKIKASNYSRQLFAMELAKKCIDCTMVCFDDIDLPLKGKPETQIEIAYLITTLADIKKVVLAGIELSDRCDILIKYLQNHCVCDYYRYVLPKE